MDNKITMHEAAIDIVLICFAAANDEERYFKVMAKLRELLAAEEARSTGQRGK